MTEEEKIICKQFLNDADKTHSCNEYKLLMALLEQKPTNLVLKNIKAKISKELARMYMYRSYANGLAKAIEFIDKYLTQDDMTELTIKDLEVLEQEPKSEWEQDHAILKAYSDGVNETLDKIRAEINTMPCAVTSMKEIYVNRDKVINILDKYKAESEG